MKLQFKKGSQGYFLNLTWQFYTGTNTIWVSETLQLEEWSAHAQFYFSNKTLLAFKQHSLTKLLIFWASTRVHASFTVQNHTEVSPTYNFINGASEVWWSWGHWCFGFLQVL